MRMQVQIPYSKMIIRKIHNNKCQGRTLGQREILGHLSKYLWPQIFSLALNKVVSGPRW